LVPSEGPLINDQLRRCGSSFFALHFYGIPAAPASLLTITPPPSLSLLALGNRGQVKRRVHGIRAQNIVPTAFSSDNRFFYSVLSISGVVRSSGGAAKIPG
jgi:hypothetical protein